MKLKFLQIVLYSLFVVFSTGCNKNNNSKGNSFSCKINGENFSATTDEELFGSPSILVNKYDVQGFEIFGSHNSDSKDPISKYVQINLPALNSSGTYSLNDLNIDILHIDDTNGIDYIPDKSRIGAVTISHFDTIVYHYCGSFSLQAISKIQAKL